MGTVWPSTEEEQLLEFHKNERQIAQMAVTIRWSSCTKTLKCTPIMK